MSMHYSVIRVEPEDSMDRLRAVFPDGKANEMNFVLFSTGGVHGLYTTIEDAEERGYDVTFLLVHPRTVTLQYGNCYPRNKDDYSFLKSLRKSSSEVAANIGFPQPTHNQRK